MGSRVVRERELGGLWSHSRIILFQVFMHGRDLIMASWDILNLKQHEIRNPISLHMFLLFFCRCWMNFPADSSMKSYLVKEMGKNGTVFSSSVVRDKCSNCMYMRKRNLAADASGLPSTHNRSPCDMEHTWHQSH